MSRKRRNPRTNKQLSPRNSKKQSTRMLETGNNLPTINFNPKTSNQAIYAASIKNNTITFCIGPAGSGKTSVATAMAIQHLFSGRIDKIVITRPVVEARGASKGLGYLPGTSDEKMRPYMMPILDELNKYIGKELTTKFIADDKIEICPLEFIRGRTFNKSFMILDETQNCTYEQIKMFLTRIGMDSVAVVNGDLTQSDLFPDMRGGFEHILNKIEGLDRVGIIELEAGDIVRNPIIAKLLERI